MTILVTGATGLVGNNVVRLLCAQNAKVRALVRSDSDVRSLNDLEVDIAEGDVRDAAAMMRACRDVEAVIHAAAIVRIGWHDLDEMRATNVGGTRNVARAALEAGARMVQVSTVNTMGVGKSHEELCDETSPRENTIQSNYVITKREAEQAVLELVDEGLNAVIVNPGFMLGPWDWTPSSGVMLINVARAQPLFSPAGGVVTCDVRDVAAAILTALKQGEVGESYILGGHNVSYLDLWQLFCKVAKRRGPKFRMSRLMSGSIGMAGDLVGKIRGKEGPINSAALRMSRQSHFYSSARAEATLELKNRPLEESVTDAWNWFREYGFVKL